MNQAAAQPPAAHPIIALQAIHGTRPGCGILARCRPRIRTCYVTEGVGRCQHRGGPIEIIRPGDRVFFEPGEDHWHGAAPDRFMTHLAMQEVDDEGSAVTWGDRVTDEEYDTPPAGSDR